MRGTYAFLLALLLASFSYAELTIFVAQVTETGSVRYSVVQRGASGENLFIAVKQGDTQVRSFRVQDFNGAANGYFSLSESGAYRVIAAETDTGDYAEAELRFVAPAPSERPAEAQPAILRGVPDYLVFLTIVLAAILLYLLAFGNPLREKPKK